MLELHLVFNHTEIFAVPGNGDIIIIVLIYFNHWLQSARAWFSSIVPALSKKQKKQTNEQKNPVLYKIDVKDSLISIV